MAKDILQLVSEKEAQACRNLRRGIIICPGALGDCLLTLPLAEYIRKSQDLGGVDFVGHTEYIDFYPGRTCIDTIKSVESIEFHRLFADSVDFSLEDYDRLIGAFSRYECIVSFMGADNANFEDNLIFTVNCSHPAHVTMMPLASDDETGAHISEFYMRKFAAENSLDPEQAAYDSTAPLLKPHKSDVEHGSEILESRDIEPDDKLVVIHPGSGGEHKCWHIDNFLSLADRLGAEGTQIAFLLGPAEQERFDNDTVRRLESVGICIAGVDITDVLQVLTWADCFVGNDSGVSHLAGVMGTRTVAIFGATTPDIYRPVGPHVHVLQPGDESFSRLCADAVDKAFETLSGILQD